MTKTSASDSRDSVTTHPIVALAGFMGSGKTSTGEALANLLGWDFVDLDAEIEALEGTSVGLFFQQKGETAFREAEHEALCKCLREHERATVIALGGGAFVQANNVAMLHEAGVLTVFLDTPVDEMLQRCGVEGAADPANPRPLAANASQFRALYEARLPHYRAARVTITTSGKSVVEVVEDIAASLELQRRV